MKINKHIAAAGVALALVAGSAGSATAMNSGNADWTYKSCVMHTQSQYLYSEDSTVHAGNNVYGQPEVQLGIDGENYASVFTGDCPTWDAIMDYDYYDINVTVASKTSGTDRWYLKRRLVLNSSNVLKWSYYMDGSDLWGTYTNTASYGWNNTMNEVWTGVSTCDGEGTTRGVSDNGPGTGSDRCYANYAFSVANTTKVLYATSISVEKLTRKGGYVYITANTNRGDSSCYEGTLTAGQNYCDAVRALNNDRIQVRLGGKIVGSAHVKRDGNVTVKFKDKAGKQRYSLYLPEVMDDFAAATKKFRA